MKYTANDYHPNRRVSLASGAIFGYPDVSSSPRSHDRLVENRRLTRAQRYYQNHRTSLRPYSPKARVSW